MDLLVDCHWRFDRDTALRLIEDLSDANLYWIECPIPESLNAIPAMQELRQACNRHDMLLAGLESLNGLDAFTPYLEREAVDIVMPDVKYAGGVEECRRIAKAAETLGALCAPHNPTGPVCHAASLHLATTIDACPILEHQFRETPIFDSLIGGAFPPVVGGFAELPNGPGWALNWPLDDPCSIKFFDQSGRSLERCKQGLERLGRSERLTVVYSGRNLMQLEIGFEDPQRAALVLLDEWHAEAGGKIACLGDL